MTRQAIAFRMRAGLPLRGIGGIRPVGIGTNDDAASGYRRPRGGRLILGQCEYHEETGGGHRGEGSPVAQVAERLQSRLGGVGFRLMDRLLHRRPNAG